MLSVQHGKAEMEEATKSALKKLGGKSWEKQQP